MIFLRRGPREHPPLGHCFGSGETAASNVAGVLAALLCLGGGPVHAQRPIGERLLANNRSSFHAYSRLLVWTGKKGTINNMFPFSLTIKLPKAHRIGDRRTILMTREQWGTATFEVNSDMGDYLQLCNTLSSVSISLSVSGIWLNIGRYLERGEVNPK
jgi:hypothetical protein